MFDFLRDLTKSAEAKRQEQLNAYLDGELSPGEQRRFEQALEQDPALRAELAELRAIKQGVRQLPRVRAPRNFTLDPAVYGKPQRHPAGQLYPVFRVATALTAIFFVLALALDLFTPAGGVGQPLALAPAAEDGIVVTSAASEAVRQQSEPVEVTRVVEEELLEGETAAEEMPEADVAADEAEEEMAEEEAIEAPAAAEALPTVALSPTPGRGQNGAITATVTLTPTATATATNTPVPTATPSPVPTAPPPSPPASPADPLPWLLIVEIGLGVGLVVLFVTTLLLRRRL